MTCSLKNGFCFSGLDEINYISKDKGVSGFCSSFCVPQSRESNLRASPILGSNFMGKSISVPGQNGSRDWRVNSPTQFSVHVCKALSCLVFSLNLFFFFFFLFFFFFFWGLANVGSFFRHKHQSA